MGLFRNNSGNDTSDELELIANISGNYYDPMTWGVKGITSGTPNDGTYFINGICQIGGTYIVTSSAGNTNGIEDARCSATVYVGNSSTVRELANEWCRFTWIKPQAGDKVAMSCYAGATSAQGPQQCIYTLVKRDRYVNPAVPELGTIYEFTWSSRLGNNNSTWVYSDTGVTVPTGLYMFFLKTGGDGNTSNDYHNYLYNFGVFNGTTNCSTMLNGSGWWTAGYGATHRTGLLRVTSDGGNRLGIINTGNQGTDSKCQLMRIV